LLIPQLPTSIGDWAEEHIRLSSGPHAGRRYRHDRHPVSRPWFDALESKRWQRYAITGPGQNGKSLLGFVIPVCYTLFELRETVFVGIPDMRLAGEKWQVDFLPTIKASFPAMLPRKGAGSRDGAIKDSVTFTNGSRLKFMSAGQGDAGLAGPTTKNLVLTEVDKYDTAREISREADPIRQMEARTNAFRDYGRQIWMECTVSIPEGRIWQEVTRGTDTRLYHPCPHCGAWTTWERSHLAGWQDAADEFAAADAAEWVCPECGATFGESERRAMFGRTVAAHRGQEITPAGEVVGPLPRTETFGLRWSAFDNPFVRTARLGQDEWITGRAINQDSAERAARQFIWAIPYEPEDTDVLRLDATVLATRQHATKRAEVPEGCLGVVLGVDTGKRALHWSAHAVLADESDVIIEYGVQAVECDRLGVTNGLIDAFGKLNTYWQQGWRDSAGKTWQPAHVWIDSGWAEHQAAVYAFCKAAGSKCYKPTKGGTDQAGRYSWTYKAPRAKTKEIRYIGRSMHSSYQKAHGISLMLVGSDYWKAEFHARLKMPAADAGSIRLYAVADQTEHADWCNHVTAERQVEVFKAGRPMGLKFETIRRANHWLDSGYAGTAAAQFLRDTGGTAAGTSSRRTLSQMASKADKQ
jgi:phage terminase large subunit GpA-like protein